MAFVIISLFALAGVLLILHPLVTRKKYRLEPEDTFALGEVRQLNHLNAKKATILDNIKELDFDYEMGKLSDDDHSALRADCLREAQEVVQAVEQLKIREEIEELIESEVRNRRRTQ